MEDLIGVTSLGKLQLVMILNDGKNRLNDFRLLAGIYDSDPFEGLRHDVLLLGINLITADAFLKGIFSG